MLTFAARRRERKRGKKKGRVEDVEKARGVRDFKVR